MSWEVNTGWQEATVQSAFGPIVANIGQSSKGPVQKQTAVTFEEMIQLASTGPIVSAGINDTSLPWDVPDIVEKTLAQFGIPQIIDTVDNIISGFFKWDSGLPGTDWYLGVDSFDSNGNRNIPDMNILPDTWGRLAMKAREEGQLVYVSSSKQRKYIMNGKRGWCGLEVTPQFFNANLNLIVPSFRMEDDFSKNPMIQGLVKDWGDTTIAVKKGLEEIILGDDGIPHAIGTGEFLNDSNIRSSQSDLGVGSTAILGALGLMLLLRK